MVVVLLSWKCKLELWIVQQLIDFGQVLLVVGILSFEGEFEELEVEDGLVRVGLVIEKFNGAIVVDQIVMEELGVVAGLHEELRECAVGLFEGLQFTVLSLVFR